MADPHTWRTSSYSGDRSNCVEVAASPDGAAVRDSVNPHHTHLAFDITEWQAFLGSVRRDEL